MGQYRVVAVDLDGTLIARDNRVSPRVERAVAGAQATGVTVLAVTGRPWQWTLDVARRHRLLPWAVVSNGAGVVDVAAGTIETTGLADGAAAGLIERIRAVEPEVVFAADGLHVLAAEPGFLDSEYLGTSELPHLDDHLAHGVLKLIARRPGVSGADLASLLDHEVLDGVAVPYHHGGEWVELLAAGVSKASGLQLVCERLGVDAAEVVAVGDGRNDMPMLAWAGLGVAMAGSEDDVVAAADRTTPAARDDGVALLLEELFGLPPAA